MLRRREFLFAVPPLLASQAIFAPRDIALAQQKPVNPELKLSEVRAAAEDYVKKVAEHAKESTGIELSEEQKKAMVNNIISGIYAQGKNR